MTPRLATQRTVAMTLTEVMVVVAILVIFAVFFLPVPSKTYRRAAERINCASNLRQIGISYKMWAENNNGSFPMHISITNGGAMELIATGNVAACFQVMSNALDNPRILVCPADASRRAATSFGSDFSRQNISYFINLDAVETQPQSLLSGDDNLTVNAKNVQPGILTLYTNDRLAWTKERHDGGGNILLADGSVQQASSADLTSVARFATNRLAIP